MNQAENKSRDGPGSRSPSCESLELVAQRELHLTRRTEGVRVFAPVAGGRQAQVDRVGIETGGVREVESLPTQLHRVVFRIRHYPALREAGIDHECSLAAQGIAGAGLSRQWKPERGQSNSVI